MKMQLALIHLEVTSVHARKDILETPHFAKVRTGIIVRSKGHLGRLTDVKNGSR